MTAPSLTRRELLGASAAALVLPIPMLTKAAGPAPAGVPPGPAGALGAFLRIGSDGTVTIVSPTAEIGQGGSSGFAQVVAEELEVPWGQVRMVFSSAAPVYANPAWGVVGTGGSTGLRARFDATRRVGATARQMLVAAAAQRWQIDAAQLKARDGAVQHPDGRRLAYAELVAEAATLTPPAADSVVLKPRSEWHTIGKPLPRLDTAAKTRGQTVFGIDFRVPGMLYAAVLHAPQFGGRVASFDANAVLSRPGVKRVLSLGNAVAVLAEQYWQAKSALDALPVSFASGQWPTLQQSTIERLLRASLEQPGHVAVTEGDVDGAATSTGARRLESVYETPFVGHARLEPANATAHVREDLIEVWSPTQTVGGVTLAVALALGVPMQRVRAHQLFAGGGFGRGGKMDLEIEAARLSREAGVPVKVVWSREEDIRAGFVRPASASRLAATVDRQGRILGWEHRTAMQSLAPWFLSELMATGMSREQLAQRLPPGIRGRLTSQGADPQALYGMNDQAYRFAARRISHVPVDLPVPVCPWRSVGHSNNAFAVECFVDEVAAAGGRDPLALRRELLAHSPRHLALLDRLAESSQWGARLPRGRGRGMAYHECYGGVGACAVEVAVNAQGSLRIERVVMVADLGLAVNPNLVRQQMEGGALFGLSAALNGRLTVRDGGIEQSSFAQNLPLTLAASPPRLEVHIIDSGAAIGGAGELSTPMVVPALVNAVFAATGRRIRRLPLNEADLSWA